MITLLPFQVIGRDFLAARSSAILADDMGLGKTYQFIEAAKLVRAQSGIILCPQSIRHSWCKNMHSQYPTVFIKEITGPKIPIDPCAFNVINYDIVWREPLISELKKYRWPLLGCDESHYLKSIDAKRTKVVLGRKGLAGLAERRWLMTGTPVLNRPIELYPTLRSLFPQLLGQYRDYTQYAFHFCAAFNDGFGFNVSGASNLDELGRILGGVMLRRLKEEVMDQLPGLMFEKIYLDPSDKLLELAKQELNIPVTDVIGSQLSSIRRALGVLKILPAIKHIEELLITKKKIVAFVWHKDVAAGMKDHFKSRAVTYTGDENVREKDAALDRFIRDDQTQIFIGQLRAAGQGIDGLQHVCDTCLIIEPSYVPGEIMQAVDRLRRMGQARPVLAQFLIVEGSRDEHIVDSLIVKQRNINTLYQGKGGQEIEAKCNLCRTLHPLSKLKRVGGLSVCPSCGKIANCLE